MKSSAFAVLLLACLPALAANDHLTATPERNSEAAAQQGAAEEKASPKPDAAAPSSTRPPGARPRRPAGSPSSPSPLSGPSTDQMQPSSGADPRWAPASEPVQARLTLRAKGGSQEFGQWTEHELKIDEPRIVEFWWSSEPRVDRVMWTVSKWNYGTDLKSGVVTGEDIHIDFRPLTPAQGFKFEVRLWLIDANQKKKYAAPEAKLVVEHQPKKDMKLEGCQADSQCGVNYECVPSTGSCRLKSASICSLGHRLENLDGPDRDCAPYGCRKGPPATCHKSCASNKDCAPGAACKNTQCETQY